MASLVTIRDETVQLDFLYLGWFLEGIIREGFNGDYVVRYCGELGESRSMNLRY